MMTVDRELLALMTQSVTLQPPSSRDGYGHVTFGASTTVDNCRIVKRPRLTRTVDGIEVTSDTQVRLDDDYGVTTAWQVTLPDGTTPPIVAVESFPDENGAHHQNLLLAAQGR